MCLPVAPYRVEREWKHRGLMCAATMANEGGHRCGYVRVPPAHLLYGKDYDLADVKVHGGLTFSEMEPCTDHEDGQGWWFGFDCGHAGDRLYDPVVILETLSPSAREIAEIMNRFKFHADGHYWTQAEVEVECESMAEQLAGLTGLEGLETT